MISFQAYQWDLFSQIPFVIPLSFVGVRNEINLLYACQGGSLGGGREPGHIGGERWDWCWTICRFKTTTMHICVNHSLNLK